ncbi:hypothetical protein CDO52_01190 [Nocardiopsis gilva YIM 90087]|uniref:Band 7 domain-containing protein n=1 Tax=Nocardiopsis gilva YIM 90087 TaxID=1235441 RepID=A0A223S0D8_9ACTN|nr:hypothetical protein [Nocardiopsis gilva]ASU81590.1 hypothetical protein CDO52_01190 [Nocardiopsis gilva YIM 90087]
MSTTDTDSDMDTRTPAFPIVERRVLQPPTRRGFLGLGGRRRDRSELPSAEAHQVLVYRTGGGYLVDSGETPLDDDRVTTADHVSLVDLGHDVPVTIEREIPSAEDAGFTLQITFTCTVTDAETVVRAGRGDAHQIIDIYLRKYEKLHRLGQSHTLSEVNTVRDVVSSQIQAYTELMPPHVPGMRIEYAGTEIKTPDVLKEHLTKRRETSNEQEIRGMVTTFTREIMVGLSESIQNRTIEALTLSVAEGKTSLSELADRIAAERDREELAEERRLQEERADEQQRREQEREDALRREAREHEWEVWAREDRHRREHLQKEVLTTAIRYGHGDDVPIDVRGILAEQLGTSTPLTQPTPVDSSVREKALPEAEADTGRSASDREADEGENARRTEHSGDRSDRASLDIREDDHDD